MNKDTADTSNTRKSESERHSQEKEMKEPNKKSDQPNGGQQNR